MKRLNARLTDERRHEILAASLVVVTALVVTFKWITPPHVQSVTSPLVSHAAPPASIGTPDVESNAPDVLATSAEVVDPRQAVEEPNEEERLNTSESEQTDESSQETEELHNEDEAEESIQSKHVSPTEPIDDPATNGDTTDVNNQMEPSEEKPEAADNLRQLESLRQPVEQMSAAQLNEAVQKYEQWIHDGQIKLMLEYSLLSPAQFNSIAHKYILRTKHSTIGITPYGEVHSWRVGDVSNRLLFGDLSPNSRDWPPVVARRARERFGSSAVVKGTFQITDAFALKLYRTLAEETRDHQSLAGKHFVVRLAPRGNDIDIRLTEQSLH